MPVVRMTAPPVLRRRSGKYEYFREWLLDNFYSRLCSYCLIQYDDLHIDHYEPREYSPHRVNDPSNLLLACPKCNGRAGKSDYHPKFLSREREFRRTKAGS